MVSGSQNSSGSSSARPGEFELIARYFAPLAREEGTFGLLDDAASYAPTPGHDLVLTKDALVAGIHFFPDDPPREIARKALRVNLSDLSAKGARSVGYLLGLGLPEGWTADWLAGFSEGLRLDQDEFDLALIGGDTVKSPERLVISVTAIGETPAGQMVRRGGARIGDVVFVTGTIGDAALGLQLRLDGSLAGRLDLSEAAQAHLLDRYLLPRPRVVAADVIRRHAHAGMDISDGLVGDLEKMARASGVRLRLSVDKVPLSSAAGEAIAKRPDFLRTALTGGDDYEIAGSVPATQWPAFVAEMSALGLAVAAIGEIVAGAGLELAHQPAGVDFSSSGSFSHF